MRRTLGPHAFVKSRYLNLSMNGLDKMKRLDSHGDKEDESVLNENDKMATLKLQGKFTLNPLRDSNASV